MLPLEFTPILKRSRWGGRRLGSVLNKPIGPADDYAESWEISDHGADQSVVKTGPYANQTLQALLQTHQREILGNNRRVDQFPLLIKYLDANDRLSVQVHPDDEQARTFKPNEHGKTEAWVIIEADPGSVVYAGLKPEIDASTFKTHLEVGTVAECLHQINVQPGDCLFIPAGTIHAIGEGILLAEIQQSSDLTFRLSDWGRVGSDGQPREIHIEPALACIDFNRGPVSPITPVILSESPSHLTEELVRCHYFIIKRHCIAEAITVPPQDECRIVMGLAGEGIFTAGQTDFAFGKGKTLLLPADCSAIRCQPSEPLIYLEATIPN